MSPETGQDALGHQARRLTTPVIDACLRHFPAAKHALELARRGLHTTMQDRTEVIDIAER